MNVQNSGKGLTKSILAITDFSESSTNAIVFAANLFANKSVKILLLNVFKKPDETKTILILVDDILGKESEKGLKKQSLEIKALLKERNLEISVHSMSGKLEKAINTIIRDQDIDLIVMGIPGKYSKNPEDLPMLFIEQSSCPILLVPENY